jgi:hypothetical protein
MTMKITRKVAIAGAGLLSIVGVGGGVALAASSPSSTVPPPATSTPAPATPVPGAVTTPDKPTAQAPEAPDAAEKPGAPEAAEKPGAEEPGDANLPGGGHADPAGQNVDHQFEGVE